MKLILRAVLMAIVVISLSAPAFSQAARRTAPAPQKQAQVKSPLERAAKTAVIRVMIAGTSMPVPEAKVNIIDMSGGIMGTVRSTDADGTVNFELADGAYIVHSGKAGYKQTRKEIDKIGYTSVGIFLVPDESRGLTSSDIMNSSTIFSPSMCMSSPNELKASELCGMNIPVTFRVREYSSMDVSNATIVYLKDVAQVKYAVTGVTDLDGVASLDMPDVSPPVEFMIFAEGYQPVKYILDRRLDVSSPPINVFLFPSL